MARRKRAQGNEAGCSYSVCTCLFASAILLGLLSFQFLDYPDLATSLSMSSGGKSMAPANVANVALLREASQHVEVMNVTGPAKASIPAPPSTSLPPLSMTARPSTVAISTNAEQPEMIWYPDLMPRTPHDAPVDLVIAAFAENLGWIDTMMSSLASNYALRLYCKGDRLQDSRCLRIHNFGGEEYAYLTHITHFYDQLAPITVFTLGSIYDGGWDWIKCRKLHFVLSNLDSAEKRAKFGGFVTMAHTKPDSFMEFEGYFKLDRYRNHAGGTPTESCKASLRPLSKWFQEFIPNVTLKKAQHTGVLYNPIFAVSRERIRQYPRSMYERLLREILRCTAKEHEGVAEAGHYLERAWKPMFEADMPDAFKCSGHFGQQKGDEACCNQSVKIELPWTICRQERPICSGFDDGKGWGTCMPADVGERVDVCPQEIIQTGMGLKKH